MSEESIFIGARTLEKKEVKIIVPTFDSIISRIEDIRIEAGAKNNKYEGIRKYNNTITLFGNRGTGKTSTMYTVRNELYENKNNIILQTIEPDNIGQEGKIMGCILGLFKAEIDKLQKQIKEEYPQKLTNEIKRDFFENCRFKENNKLKQAYNEVLEYYCYTEKEYKTLLTCNYNDMNSYIKKSSHVFNADIEFAKKFEEFVNEFINCVRNLNYSLNNDNDRNGEGDGISEPLIFIFIDDVDLNTDKCQEIIEAILRYASHPNIICFITGDYNTFNEEFTISLLKKEKLKDANLSPNAYINSKKDILQSKQELAHEFMKKVFPPAYRHYVNTWDLSLIPKYSIGFKNNESRDDLFKLLSKISEAKKIENIFGYDSEDESKVVHFLPSFNMFDRTSRGLINVFYSLFNIKNNLGNYTKEEYFVNIKGLIENIIDSSKFLVKYNDEIKRKYILLGADEGQSKIDFEQLRVLLTGNFGIESISDDTDNLLIKYSVFYLCYYISILLPKINYSKEARKSVARLAMLELISNPRLNGYDMSIKCHTNIKSYFYGSNCFVDNYYYYHYSYNMYFRGFICEILAETNMAFAQKFYKNIVNSKDLGYKTFDENYDIDETKYNSLFITFYETLCLDPDKDINTLIDFYTNEKLSKYMNFIEEKSYEDRELLYVEVIFKEIFNSIYEECNNRISILDEPSKKKFIKIEEDFLYLLKMGIKEISCDITDSIIPNDFEKNVKFIINEYNHGILDNVRNEYIEKKKKMKDVLEYSIGQRIELEEAKNELLLVKAIYKAHDNEVNSKNGANVKESMYTDPKVLNIINKSMINVYVNPIIDVFLNSVNLSEVFLTKFSCTTDSYLQIVICDDKFAFKLKKFFNTYSGVTNTKADNAKKSVRNILKIDNVQDENKIKERISSTIDIATYSQLKSELSELYFSNARYCKKEAKDLIDSMSKNIRIKFNDTENIFNDAGKWTLKGFSLFIQKAKPEVMDIREIEKAKAYLKEILPKAIEQKELKEREYLDRLGINEDNEL